MQQLAEHQVDLIVQQLEEAVQIALGLDAQAGQVDGREAEVAAAAGHLAVGVVHVAQHAGAATHVGHFAVVVTGLVVLQVERRIQEAEIGEQTHGRGLDGHLEQVVVGVAFVVVDAFLDLEDLHREDGGLAAAQTGLGGQQQVAHHHAALGGGVGAVVDGAEGHLRTGAGIHGIQVVHEGFHGLIGAAVGDAQGFLGGVGMGGTHQIALVLGHQAFHALAQFVHIGHADGGHHGQQDLLAEFFGLGGIHAGPDAHEGGEGVAIFLAEGLGHAAGHGVIEVRHALAAVHLVLVGLDGDTGQGGIALDGIGLAQMAVTGGEPVAEQRDQVDLATGLGEHVEILVMDMDVTVDVRGRGVLGQDVVVGEILGPFGTVLEHGAHGRIAVDVGVLALDVFFDGGRVGQGLVDLHQVRFRVAPLGVLGAVQDVGLGGLGVIVLDQGLFHHVLDLFHMTEVLGFELAADLFGDEQEIRGGHVLAGRLVGLGNGIENLDGIKGDLGPVPLDDARKHVFLLQIQRYLFS